KRQSTDACVGDLDVCCHTECGKRGSSDLDVTNRKLFGSQILGNNDKAEFAEFPWMLALLENKVYLCGASLIHPQVAVTAAHCVVYKTDIVVRAGEWDWAVTTEPFPHQERTVKQ
ncbi:ovochymase-2-like, partial [Anoplophora glabripennis]|uniref:ovochymase-2-like n=1 Tax=Anoplophora glabripennis TaxID=217634 RepID=UPI000C778696